MIKLKTQIAFSLMMVASLGFSVFTKADAAEVEPKPIDNPVVKALDIELKRNFKKLKKAGKAPLYFLGYRLYEGTWDSISSSYGAIDEKNPAHSWRMAAVDLRVGSPQFDNSHYLRSDRSSAPTIFDRSTKRDSTLPTHSGGIALRQSFWLKTNDAFKKAQSRIQALKASKDVLADEDDKSADFSLQSAHHFQSKVMEPDKFDRQEWEDRVNRLSRLFLGNPHIKSSSVSFTSNPKTRYIVTSEGSQIVEFQPRFIVSMQASALSEDGMKLSLWQSHSARSCSRLPDENKLEKEVKSLESTLDKLRVAPPAEPYVGPAIFSGRAAAVFFHETFGHRVESIHEKSESEGKTFSKKIGTKIMPEFLTIVDDPTVKEAYGEELSGYYVYDDEGVPAQKVDLAVNGKFTGFLLGRMLVHGFDKSNGHGRSAPGWNPQARQANLFIKADKKKQMSPRALRKLLIKEAKKQKKKYALYFEEVSGGFTWTSRGSLQTYSVLPLIVYKVYVDGRPDELIRGVDMVGTPLSALEHIVAAGTDYSVFNGVCGRESGKVPVSAVAPSLLIDSIEIKRKAKTFEKSPILKDPTVSKQSKTDGSSKNKKETKNNE